MAEQKLDILSFNKGVVSPLAMGRVDVARLSLSAETQTNWQPHILGPMSLRPGLKYVGGTRSNAAAKHIPFIASSTDTAIIELTNLAMRVRVSETIITRPAVTTAVTNGNFDTDLSGWTDADEGGTATSTWLTGGYASLLGDGTNAAKLTQAVTLGVGNANTEHALSVSINRGPVTIRVGSSAGDDDYVSETQLLTGFHSLAFTPTGTFHITLFSREEYPCLVDSCVVAGSGDMVLTTPWATANLAKVRYTQSVDVVWVAAAGVRTQRIERRGTRSWSVVDYDANKGPFRVRNLTATTITASALTGLITLTASRPLFNSNQVGALFSAESNGQIVTQTLAADNTFTNPILVTGTEAARIFAITIVGTWSATITLQRSIGAVGAWVDVVGYTDNQSATLDDSLSNQIIYYRIGIKSGGYTSGTATATLTYANGSIKGIARISAFTSSTVVTAFVLQDFGATSASDKWAEGAWSTYRGFPSAVTIHDGRLWLVGQDKTYGSVVDDFGNHDDTTIGDSGPISRSIGEGPLETLRWLISAGGNMLTGGDLAEFRMRASSEDGILTPINFNIKSVSTTGSNTTDAEVLDNKVIYVDKSGTRIRELTPNGDGYTAVDLSILSPEISEPRISDLAVQISPDIRVHAVRSDGKVAILSYSPTEEVRAWWLFETNGVVEEAFILPGTVEDAVYYVVKRTINAATVRYLEKWALYSECQGGTLNNQADSFITYSGSATTNITGLSHLEAASVAVWADGESVGSFTVSGGAITLTTAASNVVAGLPYTAQFKSTRLAQTGAQMVARTKIDHLGVILRNSHEQGLQYGPDFSMLDNLPLEEAGQTLDGLGVWSSYNYQFFEFNGEYAVDSRLCLQATAPKPCTVMAAVIKLNKTGG